MSCLRRRFFAVELTAFRHGANTISVDYGWGAQPWGALAQLPDNLQSTSTICGSDTGYRTAPTDSNPTYPYPPTVTQNLQVQRALNLDPTQSGVGASWGQVRFTDLTALWDAIAGSWNTDSRQIRVLYGFKTLEEGPGLVTQRNTIATYTGPTGLIQTAQPGQVRYDFSQGYPPPAISEPAGENYCSYSEQVGGTGWTSFGSPTVTLNAGTAPDGNNTATEFVFSGGDYSSFVADPSPSGGAACVSLYMRAPTPFTLNLRITWYVGSTEYNQTVACTLTSAWQRFHVGATLQAGASSVGLQIDGSAGTFFAWGAQLEFGALTPTSFIPTVATAPVTRAADYPVPARGIFLDPPYTELSSLFTGLAQTWQLTDTELVVPIRDASYWLERPLQTTLYLGTGGDESPIPYTGAPPPPPNSTSLQGMTKPKTRGGSANYPVRNITPVLVDPVTLVYQYNDAPGTVVALYEGGATGITFQSDVADFFDGSGNPIGTTNAGQYQTCNAKGLFRLGSTPVYAITADVTGAFPDGTAETAIGPLVRDVMLKDIGLPSSSLDLASFSATGGPAWQSWSAGVYFTSEATDWVPFQVQGTTNTDGVQAISAFLAGTGLQLIPMRNGQLALIQLTAPSGTPALVLDQTNAVSVTPQSLPATLDPPPFRMRVTYQHNYTVQQQSALSPSINLSWMQFVQAQDRYMSAGSTTVINDYLRPNDPAPVPSALLVPNDAQSAANNLIALWGTRRRLYSVVVPFELGVQVDIGSVVQLTWSMDNLPAGQLGLVVGDQFNIGDPTMTLSVLV